ncbi:MAG: hypothetical protein ACOC2C_07445, partial [Cyclonatronaceae bacterium]
VSDQKPRLLITHRLHSFHADYLTEASGNRKFTYDEFRPRLLKRLREAGAAESARERFDSEIPGPEADGAAFQTASDAPERITTDLGELFFFLKHPLRWAMERRMGMRLPRIEEQASGRDVFQWDSLQKYKLRQELLEKLLEYERGRTPQPAEPELRHYFRRKGMLPYQDIGYFNFAEEYRNIKGFIDQIPEEYRRFRAGAPQLKTYIMQVNQVEVSIQQRVHRPVGGGHVIIDHAQAKPKRVMEHWLHHLFTSLTTEPEMRTRYISLKKERKAHERPYEMMVFEPDEQAHEHLQALVATYLNCRELPPPFTPKALELLHASDTAEEKKEKKLEYFQKYFNFSTYEMEKYSTLYGDDPYAELFYKGYQQEFESQLRDLKDRFWAGIKLQQPD